jgi:fibro-slime domain-containing protein
MLAERYGPAEDQLMLGLRGNWGLLRGAYGFALAGLAIASCTSTSGVHGDEGDGPATAGEGGEGAGGNGGSLGGAVSLGGSEATGGRTGGAGGTIALGGTTSVGGTATGGATSGGSATGGTSGGKGGVGGGEGGQGACAGVFTGYIRDFQPNVHPDFEPHMTKPTAANFYNEIETGIVQAVLGANSKPVYAGGATGTNTTLGPTYFPSWFTDTPNVNIGIEYIITLVDLLGDGMLVFDASPFLPIDDGAICPVQPQTPCLLGNSTNYPTHNYAYTFELHTRFVHRAGGSFRFAGDDDVWIFVNGQLVVDMGGIHQRILGTVNLDELMGTLGLVPGNEYTLELFRAERHVTQSNFRVETNLEFTDCGFAVAR